MYFVALEGVTRYALSEAVKAVLRNKLGHTFFPSPVELRKLCDDAQRPHIEMARRARIASETMASRREQDAAIAARTPQARARIAAIYTDFCSAYRTKESEFVPSLDPELVAMVPDAPSTFKQAKVA